MLVESNLVEGKQNLVFGEADKLEWGKSTTNGQQNELKHVGKQRQPQNQWPHRAFQHIKKATTRELWKEPNIGADQ